MEKLKGLIKNIQFYFGMILTNTLFSILHLVSNTNNFVNNIYQRYKFETRYYYHKIKYVREPIKLQIWLEKEIINQNVKIIKECDELLKIFNQPVDLSKIRK